MLVRSLYRLVLMAACLAASAAQAVDYVSVSAKHAILYDAPSLQAKKLFVVNRYMPFESVVSLDAWVKVRDRKGDMAWIEKSALSYKRYVYAVTPVVDVRKDADVSATSVLQVRQQVALEWLESTGTGWLKVRHQDGVVGYVKQTDVWGD
ncbi:MAG: SH3 domain-containing protein [Gallionella sp.]